MTRLEKVKELHPELIDEEIVGNCPEEILPIDEISFTECKKFDWNCNLCWNQQYEEKVG